MPDRLSYDEAMLYSQRSIKIQDPELKQGTVEMYAVKTAAGEIKKPWGIEGGFAVVYKFRTQSGQMKALRCFRVAMNLDTRSRYESMSKYFRVHVPNITIDFQYYEEGISVSEMIQGMRQRKVCPVIAMEWIDGVTLLDKIDELCRRRDKQTLEKLAGQWLAILEKMRQVHMAHGDLAGVNVMVHRNDQLVLIDYDGVYIPEFAGLPQVVLGQQGYQHPDMMNRPFNEQMDDFSALVIYVSLLALQMQPELWDKYVKRNARGQLDGNMLFTRDDFIASDTSPLFAELLRCSDTKVRELAAALKAFCKQPVEQVRFPMHLLDPDYACKQALQQLEEAIRNNNDEQIIQLWIPPLDSYGPAQQYFPRVMQARQQRERIDRFRAACQQDDDEAIVAAAEAIEQARYATLTLSPSDIGRVALARRRKTALAALRAAFLIKSLRRIAGAYSSELEGSKNITRVELERAKLAVQFAQAYRRDDDQALIAAAEAISRSPYTVRLVMEDQEERERVVLARKRVAALAALKSALASQDVFQIAAAAIPELAASPALTPNERQLLLLATAFVEAYHNDNDEKIVEAWQEIEHGQYAGALQLDPQEQQRLDLARQRKAALSRFRLACYRSRNAHEIVLAYSPILDNSIALSRQEHEILDAARRYIVMYDSIKEVLQTNTMSGDLRGKMAAYDEELAARFTDFTEEERRRIGVLKNFDKLERALVGKAYRLALVTASEIEGYTRTPLNDNRLSVARMNFIKGFEAKDLRVQIQSGQAFVSWNWPNDLLVQFAVLVWRADRWPLHPRKEDPDRLLYRINRGFYEQYGYYQFSIGLVQYLYVQVYFAFSEFVEQTNEMYWFYSRGDEPTSKWSGGVVL